MGKERKEMLFTWIGSWFFVASPAPITVPRKKYLLSKWYFKLMSKLMVHFSSHFITLMAWRYLWGSLVHNFLTGGCPDMMVSWCWVIDYWIWGLISELLFTYKRNRRSWGVQMRYSTGRGSAIHLCGVWAILRLKITALTGGGKSLFLKLQQF